MSPIGIAPPQLTSLVDSRLAPSTGAGNFQDVLSDAIRNVENQGANAHQAVQQYLSGETEDLHKVALAAQRAELSTELFLQVRNKVISAYQEVMKMQM